MLNLNLPPASHFIDHTQKILSIGSCFTEHIGNAMQDLKFSVLQNPNGILFDPASVCASIVSYLQAKEYGPGDLFYHNELWQSWNHHSRFSGMDQGAVIEKINGAQKAASAFFEDADGEVLTLGSCIC